MRQLPPSCSLGLAASAATGTPAMCVLYGILSYNFYTQHDEKRPLRDCGKFDNLTEREREREALHI